MTKTWQKVPTHLVIDRRPYIFYCIIIVYVYSLVSTATCTPAERGCMIVCYLSTIL